MPEEIYGYKKHPERNFKHWVSFPFIWLPFFFIVPLDIIIELYHRVAFPLYKLEYKKRGEYIIFDRQKLSYLPWYDKIACTYCAYANGIFLYWAAIASETEKYWCGIKHHNARIRALKEEEKHFLKFGDKKAFKQIEKEGQKEKE